jgi:hypothetical protein
MRWLRRSAALFAVVLLQLIGAATFASATFVDGEVASGAVASKRIFPTSEVSSAWELQDWSSGVLATTSDAWSAVDARLFTSSTLTNAFGSTRFVELTLHKPLPTGAPVSAVTLNLTMAASGGGTACVYAEVRRISTNELLGTQGSSTTPLACSSSTTQTTTTSALSYVTSSTVADDLKVKLFLRSSTGQRIAFDRVNVTGTMHSTTFTLQETSVVNSSSGTATTTQWSLATADTTSYSPSAAWPSTFSVGRYLRFNLPVVVPSGSTITGVTLRHAYASAVVSAQTCTYVEIYSGSTLIASRGSNTTPLSCNSTTTQTTDTLTLTEVDTATEVNTLSVRVYVRNGSLGQSRHGLLTATVSYSLT